MFPDDVFKGREVIVEPLQNLSDRLFLSPFQFSEIDPKPFLLPVSGPDSYDEVRIVLPREAGEFLFLCGPGNFFENPGFLDSGHEFLLFELTAQS
jgi:hypothetical protein